MAQDNTLTTVTAERLLGMLSPHPGRTVTDPVTGGWRWTRWAPTRLTSPADDLTTGHWPMITAPNALAARIHWQQRT